MNESRRSILRKASALSALAVGASATASAADCSGVPEWDSSTAYGGGDQVTFDGELFTAEWWTQGSEPDGSKSVWTNEGACDGSGGGDDGGGDDGGGDDGSGADCSGVSAYDSSAAYSGGDQVTYEGSLWTAEWWTQGTAPAESENVWTLEGTCDGGSGDENEAPTASFTTDASTPEPGQDVGFDASGSTDSDGSISSYSWDFGDGSSGSGESATHSYSSASDYTVTLTVTDNDGATDSASQTVSVSEGTSNEAPDASFTVSPSSPEPGQSVTVDAADSSDADGTISSYAWEFGDGSSASGQTASHSFGSADDYTVTLTVTDDDGATDTNSTTVAVESDDSGGGGGTADNRIVGYWMQWAQYDREYTPGDIPTDQVTHLQYAFMAPEPDGTISGLGGTSAQKHLFPESWHDVTTFGDISSNTDVTCLISIGGWSDSENFSDVALDESSRQKFADECVRIVREAGVDGVDIDWEYPGGGGHADNTVRDGDQERFTQLIQACRDALDAAGDEDGRDYKLTAAMVSGGSKAEGLDHGTLSSLFDFVSIMTFDMRGGFSDYTGHASPLFQNPNDPSDKASIFNVSSGVSWYVDKGWDASQLNIATPFYGRSFSSVEAPSGGLGNGTDDGLFQNFSGTGEGSFPPDTSSSGIYDYWDLSTVGTARATSQVDLSASAWTTSYDDTAKAAWSYNPDDSLMISHPTPDSVAERASWLADSDYGGTMIWALSHDTVEHDLLGELSNGLL